MKLNPIPQRIIILVSLLLILFVAISFVNTANSEFPTDEAYAGQLARISAVTVCSHFHPPIYTVPPELKATVTRAFVECLVSEAQLACSEMPVDEQICVLISSHSFSLTPGVSSGALY